MTMTLIPSCLRHQHNSVIKARATPRGDTHVVDVWGRGCSRGQNNSKVFLAVGERVFASDKAICPCSSPFSRVYNVNLFFHQSSKTSQSLHPSPESAMMVGTARLFQSIILNAEHQEERDVLHLDPFLLCSDYKQGPGKMKMASFGTVKGLLPGHVTQPE